MTENAPVRQSASDLSVPDVATVRAIERATSSGGSAKALGGSIATLLATGGQLLGGPVGIVMVLIAPTVALLIPPTAQSLSDTRAVRRDDKDWLRIKKHFDELMTNQFVSTEDKDVLTKAWEQAKAKRAQTLLGRVEQRSKARWSSAE